MFAEAASGGERIEEESPETPLARLLQANQLKEIARALNRPVELVKRAVDVIKKARSSSGSAIQQDAGASGRAGRIFPQSGRSVASLHER